MRSRGRPPILAGARRYPNRLKELRGHARLSQQSVAVAAGISVAYYGALERGDKRINADTAGRLAGPLRCASGDLLSGGAGVSVPLSIAVAAAEAEMRPERFDLPEPHELVRPGRLADAEDCFAAEIFDDSADLDFPRGAVLFVRALARPRAQLRPGDKVIVRFFLEPRGNAEPRPTHEILYGIIDRNVVGDLVLITRTRNRLIPRHVLIQTTALDRPGLAERTPTLMSREAALAYESNPADPGEVLGVVTYAMGPV